MNESASHGEPVVVLRSSDEVEMMMARSRLEAAEIPCHVAGQNSQDMFALGRLGANPLIEPMRLFVPASRAEEARALLAAPPENADAPPDSAGQDD